MNSFYSVTMKIAMNDEMFDDLAIEERAKTAFGVKIDIDKVLALEIPAGRSVSASVVLTKSNKLYVILDGAAPLTLGDVRKIILRMGLKAEAYCSPKGRPRYFEENALERFKTVYPGRRDITDTDLRFYRLMVPYCPALVSIEEIKHGVINQFDALAQTGWRSCVKANYKNIKPISS